MVHRDRARILDVARNWVEVAFRPSTSECSLWSVLSPAIHSCFPLGPRQLPRLCVVRRARAGQPRCSCAKFAVGDVTPAQQSKAARHKLGPLLVLFRTAAALELGLRLATKGRLGFGSGWGYVLGLGVRRAV